MVALPPGPLPRRARSARPVNRARTIFWQPRAEGGAGDLLVRGRRPGPGNDRSDARGFAARGFWRERCLRNLLDPPGTGKDDPGVERRARGLVPFQLPQRPEILFVRFG